MPSREEQIRTALAEQASEWFVATDEESLGTPESEAFAAWLHESPLHVEEFLGVAVIARDLRTGAAGAEHSIDALVAAARVDDDGRARPLWPRSLAALRQLTAARWLIAATAAASLGALAVGLLLVWSPRLSDHGRTATTVTALRFQTRHGEQQTHRLADNSVLHLNTDTAVTVRYSKTERLVMLMSGETEFEVAHATERPFRVLAGPAEVVDRGTNFDVRLEHGSTLVTVVAGEVAVRPASSAQTKDAGSARPPEFIELRADQQLHVIPGEWPAALTNVDAKQSVGWLHRQITFENEPLERVASEFNRYAPKSIEVMTPELRKLEISGVFATDDPEEFLAFLRSLEGVRVEETDTRILVWRSR